MKTTKSFKRFFETLLLWIYIVTIVNPIPAIYANSDNKIVYPLKEISKLECRFKLFSNLWSNCKEKLPILKTKDYQKYSEQNWGYNKFTRIYTELWWASYEYGWDVWNGWHIWTDIATSRWTPVYSIANWEVTIAKDFNALWKTITIKHKINWKIIYSNYSHLSKIDVIRWSKIKVWEKIWEVGSTWNSTWNHLHFQIDLDTHSHPYYYDYDSCPYSYYKITESWVCFNELKNNTIDPLLFLETNWKILDNIKIVTNKIIKKKITYSNTNKSNLSIFNKTVYYWYPSSDIKDVQEVFKNLWKYNWAINWNFKDIEETIISYQISSWVLKTRNDEWAGWFGPKTRRQVKIDYNKIPTKNKSNEVAKNIVVWNVDSDTKLETDIQVKKISRKKLMSREQIEAKEIDNFIRWYNIDFKTNNIWWNIEKGSKINLKLQITNKSWELFKWSIPWDITFIVDNSKIDVFPKKFYYFENWVRNISISWLKTWNTTLYIKMWKKTIKSIPLKVYSKDQTFFPETWKTIASNKIVLWESKTAIVLFKDNKWRKLINLKYWSTFKIDTSDWVDVCIKKWSIKDVRKVYSRKCSESEFKKNVNFTYDDTVWWLLIFDYKATWRDANINIINNYNNKNLTWKKLVVNNPKWLKNNYAYKNEVITLIEKWIVKSLNKWYFLEDRDLTELDALAWIENSLNIIQNDVIDPSINTEINKNLNELKNKNGSKYKTLTRKELLDLSYKYLVYNESSLINREYIDLSNNQKIQISNIFENNKTWKDKFWKKYYRPDVKVTRWEWAFLLSNAMERNRKRFLTLK